ncbi:hypothetical protein M758_11G131000 [Ceratodon purpureus]|nr:hypothetical protein M758_11G131000 [Ceratodon purpureus]
MKLIICHLTTVTVTVITISTDRGCWQCPKGNYAPAKSTRCNPWEIVIKRLLTLRC